MKLVIVESPFAPKGRYTDSKNPRFTKENWLQQELDENLRYARLCLRDCLMRGEAPFASHLLFTQEGVLDDTKPDERKLGMQASFEMGKHAVLTVVYTDMGISPGMEAGIATAHRESRLVEHRKLPGWDGWKMASFLERLAAAPVFKPVPKCEDNDCDLPAVHCEHWHERMRYWCEQHTPWSGHSLDQNCGPQCVALKTEVGRRLFG